MAGDAQMIKIPDEHPTKYLKPPKSLDGYWWETGHLICVPFVASRNEGKGSLSKWLKELEVKGKIVFFPTIISARFSAILRARGYEDTGIMDKQMGFVYGLAKEMPR